VLAKTILRDDSGRHRNRDEIQRTLDFIRVGILSKDLDGNRVDHADARQGAHILLRVVVEAKVDRLRHESSARSRRYSKSPRSLQG
jgi:hypothetical protein